MKIQEILKLAELDLPGDARSLAADQTRTMLAPVRAPSRIARQGSQGIVPDAGPNHGLADDLSFAPDPSPISPLTISLAQRRDLDFIRSQLARLPRRAEQ